MAKTLTGRKDDKVTLQDHRKFEQAVNGAKVGVLSDKQKANIDKFESNLIIMAKRGLKNGIVFTARDDIELLNGAAMRLTSQLLETFDGTYKFEQTNN